MKGNRKMVFLGVILVIIALMGGSLVLQNSRPQTQIGVNEGQFFELSNKPNGVSTQTSYEDKLVKPLPFKEDLAASKKAIEAALVAYGNIEIQVQESNYIYAIATTPKMKFKDDLEFYFDEVKKVIHFRSASRAGYSDTGLNRQRYEAIAKQYEVPLN